MSQASLFAAEETVLPSGMRFEPDWLGVDEEAALIGAIRALTLREARYKQYTARRRVASFGGRFSAATALGLRAGRVGALAVAAQHRADQGTALLGLAAYRARIAASAARLRR